MTGNSVRKCMKLKVKSSCVERSCGSSKQYKTLKYYTENIKEYHSNILEGKTCHMCNTQFKFRHAYY